MNRMDGKVALIVAGGAGMGAEAAKRLAADGAKVAILSSSGRGEALAQELGGIGVTGSYFEPADLERFVQAAMDAWGRIDVVVNSAADAPKGELLELTDEDWHTALDAYYLNVVRMARLVTPIMAAQGGGAFVNISTYAA